jgi:hypothetical protein
MENFVQNRYQNFVARIDELPDLKNLALKNPGSVAELLKRTLTELKTHFSENPFADQSAEIRFFKYEKPGFYSEYIFALELFTVECNKPHAEELVVKAYYEQELRFIRRFFDQYRYLYQYYLLDGMELDVIYFTAGQKQADLLLPDSPDADWEFSSPADFLFAKFLALERLQEYLMKMLYPSGLSSGVGSSHLRWTGDKINLVELAYGIYNTAQLNDGEVHITDIISWLESSFNLKLSRYFQMYSEIKNRKSVSKTRFLDHMSKMINLHIEQGDAFVPEKPKVVSGSKPGVKS